MIRAPRTPKVDIRSKFDPRTCEALPLKQAAKRKVQILQREEGHQEGELKVFHPGGNPWANLESISHRCHLREVAFQ